MGFELCTTVWVFIACVLGEGVERDAFVVGWSFFHIIIICFIIIAAESEKEITFTLKYITWQ